MCREARGEESETCMGSQERRHREGSRGLGQGRKGAGRVSLETEAEEGEGRALESSCKGIFCV